MTDERSEQDKDDLKVLVAQLNGGLRLVEEILHRQGHDFSKVSRRGSASGPQGLLLARGSLFNAWHNLTFYLTYHRGVPSYEIDALTTRTDQEEWARWESGPDGRIGVEETGSPVDIDQAPATAVRAFADDAALAEASERVSFDTTADMLMAANRLVICHGHHFAVLPSEPALLVGHAALSCLRS